MPNCTVSSLASEPFCNSLPFAGGCLSISAADLYAARVACFEDLTLTAYFRTFKFSKKSKALNLSLENIDVAAPENGAAVQTLALPDIECDNPLDCLNMTDTRDAFGNQVVERKGLVRVSHNHSVYNSAGFFYNLLLNEVIHLKTLVQHTNHTCPCKTHGRRRSSVCAGQL